MCTFYECVRLAILGLASSLVLAGCQITPQVTSFSPIHSVRCDKVTFNGTGLYGKLDSLLFNNVPSPDAQIAPPINNYTPSNTITASVPETATSGPIAVKFSSGSSIVAQPANLILSQPFTVDRDLSSPVINTFSVSAMAGVIGSSVTADWTVTGASHVELNNQSVSNMGSQAVLITKSGVQMITLTAYNHNPCFSASPQTRSVIGIHGTGQFAEALPQTSGSVNGPCTLDFPSTNPGYLTARFICGTRSTSLTVRKSSDLASSGYPAVVPAVGGAAIVGTHTGVVFGMANPGFPILPVDIYIVDLRDMTHQLFHLAQGDGNTEDKPPVTPVAIPTRIFVSPDESILFAAGAEYGSCYCRTTVAYDLTSGNAFGAAQVFSPTTDSISVFVADDPMHAGKQEVTGIVNGKPLSPIPLN